MAVELLITDNWEDTCQAFKETNPDWILLDRDKVREIVGDRSINYEDKHFILPYDLVNRRYMSTRLNLLVVYMVVQARKKANTFTIIAPSKDRVDLKLQQMIDKEIKWV